MNANVVERTPVTEPLNAFLLDVVQTLKTAVSQGTKAAVDNPVVTEKAVQDCSEMIEVIMKGEVEEWVA